MLSRGLTDEGWQTAWGVYNVTYNRGLWFRTPEAYDVDGNFRAAMSLRPLAIWSIEYAIRLGRGLPPPLALSIANHNRGGREGRPYRFPTL
jgi:hypothetical protein